MQDDVANLTAKVVRHPGRLRIAAGGPARINMNDTRRAGAFHSGGRAQFYGGMA